MSLAERNDAVKAHSADRAQAFAERIRLRVPNRSLQNCQNHRRKRPIDAIRVNRVSIVDHESVRLVAGDDHAKLLRRPVRRRMSSAGLAVCRPPSTTNGEITRNVAVTTKKSHASTERVVPHEGAPRLHPLTCARWSRRHVSPHLRGGHPNSKFHEELGGDPFLPPRPIYGRHRRDQIPRMDPANATGRDPACRE